jgi:hypothetical protein
MMLADEIRAFVVSRYIGPARRNGSIVPKQIKIVSGDVVRELNLQQRVPAVCGALDARKFLDSNGLKPAWARLFLNGVTETASKGVHVFSRILALRTEVEQATLQLGKRSPNAQRFLNLLLCDPLVTSEDIERDLQISQPTAGALIRDFVKLHILKEITGQMRGRVYVFDRYLNLFTR